MTIEIRDTSQYTPTTEFVVPSKSESVIDDDYWGDKINTVDLDPTDGAILHALQHNGIIPHTDPNGIPDGFVLFHRYGLEVDSDVEKALSDNYRELLKANRRNGVFKKNFRVDSGMVVYLPEEKAAQVAEWYQIKLEIDGASGDE